MAIGAPGAAGITGSLSGDPQGEHIDAAVTALPCDVRPRRGNVLRHPDRHPPRRPHSVASIRPIRSTLRYTAPWLVLLTMRKGSIPRATLDPRHPEGAPAPSRGKHHVLRQSRLSRRRLPTTIEAQEGLEEYGAGLALLFCLEQCRVGRQACLP